MQALRVCVDARPLSVQKAGIARYIMEMLKACSDSKKVEWILISNRPLLFDVSSYSNITFIHDPKPNIPGTLWFTLFAPRLAVKYKCDILWGTQHVLPLSKPANIKYIVTWHDMVYKIKPDSMSLYNRLINLPFYKNTLNKADLILSVSETTKSDLLRFYPYVNPDKTTVLYEGKTHIPLSSSSNPIHAPYLFALGSLDPRKNLLSLVKAFEELHTKRPELKLVISGGQGWKSSGLLTYIQNCSAKDSIILTGYVSDEAIGNYFKYADLFIFPSEYEGFGLPLLEAEGQCPAVANNIPVFREISKGFKNLNFCDFSQSPSQIAEDLNTLLNKRPKVLQFKDNYRKIFSWETAISKWIELAKKIMK